MRKKIIIALVSISCWASSCQKNLDVFVPDPGQPTGADTNWVSGISGVMPVSVLKDSISLPLQADSIYTQSADTIQAAGGFKCILPANCLQSGNTEAVTGNVKVEFLLLKKKGDLIRMNKPTISDSNILATAGTMYLKITKDGSLLQVKPTVGIELKIYDQAPASFYKLYNGEETIPGKYNWKINADSGVNSIRPDSVAYTISTNRLDWISAAHPLETASLNRTQLNLPVQYTNANTTAYLVLSNQLSVINMYGNPAEKKFSCPGMPVGSTAIAVVISKQGNDYFAGLQNFTVGGGIQELAVLPIKTDLAAIRLLLDGL